VEAAQGGTVCSVSSPAIGPVWRARKLAVLAAIATSPHIEQNLVLSVRAPPQFPQILSVIFLSLS
jgi:hypothetical protein